MMNQEACIERMHQCGLKADVIEQKLKERLGENTSISFIAKTGNNGSMRLGVAIRAPHAAIAMVIYLDSMVLEVMDGRRNIDEMVDGLVHVYLNNKDREKAYQDILDFGPEYILKNVRCQLVNREMNRQLLMRCPNTEYLDLAVIYRVLVKKDGEIKGTILVDNKMCQHYQIEKEHLETCAWQNTERDGFALERISPADIDDGVLYIAGTQNCYQGAAVMLFTSFLREISDQLGRDLYIFPSSVHEVLIAPINSTGPDVGSLKDMVEEANRNCIPKDKILSDSVYRYSRSMNVVERIA